MNADTAAIPAKVDRLAELRREQARLTVQIAGVDLRIARILRRKGH